MAAAMDVLTIGTAVHGTIRPQDKMPEPDELDSDEPMRLEEELLIQVKMGTTVQTNCVTRHLFFRCVGTSAKE